MPEPLEPGFYRCELVVDGQPTEADIVPAPGQTEEEAAMFLAALLFPGWLVERFTVRPRPH